MWRWIHKWGSPKWFFQISLPWSQALMAIALVMLSLGLVWGLALAPADYQMGQSFRIIYVHVPSAILAQSLYVWVAILGAIGLIWNLKITHVLARAVMPLGTSFVFLALLTGGLWGMPTWGTYWQWDARMTSTLFLLFLYLGLWALYVLLPTAMPKQSAYKAASILALVGVVNIPIIKFSVEWWNSLHQPATFRLTEAPAMPVAMWAPLLLMVLGLYALSGALILKRARWILLADEHKASWAQDELSTLLQEKN